MVSALSTVNPSDLSMSSPASVAVPFSWSFSKLIDSLRCKQFNELKILTQYNFVHIMSELVPVGGDKIHPAALAVQDHGVHTKASLGLQLGQFSSLV